MKNDRLSRDRVADLLHLAEVGRYPLNEKLAGELCSAEDPTGPCTLVYGLDDEDGNLVSIMTATYSITFPHEDGYRMVHISGAYTREDCRHQGLASRLLSSIERDARTYFKAHYLCCDSTARELYERSGFQEAPEDETRMWKPL